MGRGCKPECCYIEVPRCISRLVPAMSCRPVSRTALSVVCTLLALLVACGKPPAATTRPPGELLIGRWGFDTERMANEFPGKTVPGQREGAEIQFHANGTMVLHMNGTALEFRYRIEQTDGATVHVLLQEELLGSDETRDTKLTYTFEGDDVMRRGGVGIDPAIYVRRK